ncbi:carcinoembryonic antigen-related cell adhesion molecule 6-like isoform X2 [Rousettus aegyptiacus]|uniref:carcinoembryonic antigen-related cell adhesion molecule 6-like isoform X2 n=1 Tax=Rousettus aegyptiacus TaxID=9407 RepID=UPI00168D89F9|nr:carcinoembryonic antigen-related cell adhesion molecule 6-like isoform X2 [Rousettus aegyptiacus]
MEGGDWQQENLMSWWWRGAGKTQVSLLTSWNPPTTAQLTLESLPSSAAEGKDVLLLVHNLPEGLAGLSWYKGASVDSNRQIASYVIDSQTNVPGPAYSGRETIYPNGSLLLQNVTLEDTGYYTLQAIKKNLLNEKVIGQLRVYPELPTPKVTSNNSNPVENKDPVVFTCEPQTQDTTNLWLINHQSISNSAWLQLSKDNRTLTLLRVTRDDSGPYECVTWNPGSASHSDPFHLNVLYGPETPTISPSDSHYSSRANLSLSCHAASNPPAQYSWLINGRAQQPTQELFIPHITANNSGSYTCLVHNSVTGLSRTTVKIITVSAGKNSTGHPVGTISGIVIGVLVGLLLLATLLCFLLLRKTGRASGQLDLREHHPPASNPGHGPSGTSTSPALLSGLRTEVPIYQELLNPNTNIYCRIHPKADVAS